MVLFGFVFSAAEGEPGLSYCPGVWDGNPLPELAGHLDLDAFLLGQVHKGLWECSEDLALAKGIL